MFIALTETFLKNGQKRCAHEASVMVKTSVTPFAIETKRHKEAGEDFD